MRIFDNYLQWSIDLPIIAIEQSDRELALKLPKRIIYYKPFKDRNRYKAEHCRRMRVVNGVGNKRKLNGEHDKHLKMWLNKWQQ